MNNENDNYDFSFNKEYYYIKQDSNIILTAENEEEKKLLDEIENTLKQKIKRLSKNHHIKTIGDEKRDSLTLDKCLDEYYEFVQNTKVTSGTISKYKQSIEYLTIFFGSKKLIKQINTKDSNEFRNFLIKVPKNYKAIKELKGKDIKLLIFSKSKILNNYDRQNLSSVEEIIKKVKSMFNYFESNLYIIKSPFNVLKPLISRTRETNWKEFKTPLINSIFKHLEDNNLFEEFKICKTYLYTGTRRDELVYLKVINVNFEKNYIDLEETGTKTSNSKRIIPIHKDILELLKEQCKNKNDNDLVFFNLESKKWKFDQIGGNIGELLNTIILKIVGKEQKIHYNIHSFRKNFQQEIFLQGQFKGLDFDTIIGHSTKSNVSDNHYLLGKRNYKMLSDLLNDVDFSHYFKYKKSNNNNYLFLN